MECGFLDCDDSDPTVHPFAPEIRNDGIDQNCNGALRCGTLVEGGGDAMTATRAAWPHDMLVMGTVAMFVWRRARRWRTKR
ncbi:MAG: putative metal-binding motif-containing protein [Myxococcales bacterium]|nr:putative metal-binding motif-containing protein [Myxococcales bacterium]